MVIICSEKSVFYRKILLFISSFNVSTISWQLLVTTAESSTFDNLNITSSITLSTFIYEYTTLSSIVFCFVSISAFKIACFYLKWLSCAASSRVTLLFIWVRSDSLVFMKPSTLVTKRSRRFLMCSMFLPIDVCDYTSN